jgi:hypothetical protein
MSHSLQQILSAMQNKTVTLGWDVVVAYNAASVNDLFAAQYVTNVRNNQNLLPINATLSIPPGLSVQLVNLVLGPPLISFSPSTTDQQAVVTMNFVAGEVLVIEASGNTQYVAGYQSIVPGDDYQLSMIVPLQQAQGSVAANNAVYVDLTNAATYSANLLSGTAAASYLGQYFQTLFQKETGGVLTYQLGTLVTGASENLTPTSFDIRTQVYPGTSGPDGAVILLVATTYNPQGGDLPGAAFPYLIPDGETCGLVVASKTLFSNILAPFYTRALVGSPAFDVKYFSGSTPAAYLSCIGGNVNAGIVTGRWSSGDTEHNIWSGSTGMFQENQHSIEVPYSGWVLQPENDLLTMAWNSSFTQEFGSSMSVPRSEGIWTDSHVNLTLSASFSAMASVSNQQISFSADGSPNVNVTFQSSGWLSKYFGNGGVRDHAAGQIVGNARSAVQQVMQVPIPQVNAFAVSHLLFPGENVLQYSDAHLPGDLAVFGQIQPTETAFTLSPLQAVIGAGETQQFTVQNGSGATTWRISSQLGSISTSGLYTAPPTISQATPLVITATEGDNVATAVVTIVPYSISVSPAYSMVFPATKSLAFQASVLGQAGAPTWSISPDDGSAGTVDANGVYTPPASFPTVVAVAEITATAGGSSASALLCLADVTLAFTLAPNFSMLGPNGAQQFTVSPELGVTWSLLPAIGSISTTGLYTAPPTISQAATVLVSAAFSGLVGVAPVILQPTS